MDKSVLTRTRPGPSLLSLPEGRGNVLCPRVDGSLPAVGTFAFRGHRLRIEVPDPDMVLFPTDVGGSLLCAVQSPDALTFTGARVLDIGSGSGLYTVAALAAGAEHVTALDINPACKNVTLTNAALNGLDPNAIEGVAEDLSSYRPRRRFDLILANPPHFPADPVYAREDGLEVAAVGGPDGRALYDVILARVDDLLAPGGTLVIAHSSLTDIPRTIADLVGRGYQCHTIGVCELDIPMLVYAAHRDRLLANLSRLRDQGKAAFSGTRFTVHTLAFTR